MFGFLPNFFSSAASFSRTCLSSTAHSSPNCFSRTRYSASGWMAFEIGENRGHQKEKHAPSGLAEKLPPELVSFDLMTVHSAYPFGLS